MAEVTIGRKTFLIPEPGSPCELWRSYFKRLKQDLGTDNARTIWLITWSKNGSTLCTTNADFNLWLKRNQIDVSNAATRAVADISQISGNIMGLGKNLTKMLSIAVPATLGITLLIILFFLFRNARTTGITELKGGLR